MLQCVRLVSGMMTRPPVHDWFSDFDLLDPEWVAEPFSIWDDMRKSCPVAHTDRYNGIYFLSRYEDVRAAAYDTEHFSSRRIFVREHASLDPKTPPITSDPPHHRPARLPLMPRFSPAAVQELEAPTREICANLIDRLIDANGLEQCDVARDYALHIPMHVMLYMFGLPTTAGPQYRQWILDILENGITDHTLYLRAVAEMRRALFKVIMERKRNPGDDLVSYLLSATFEDKPLEFEHIIGSLALLMIAGVETSGSALCSIFLHLATNPEDRRRLVADPELRPTAIEEFLRAYSPQTISREIIADTKVGECPMKSGEMLILSFPSANRDPEAFPDPDRVIIDRKENRHMAFGAGIHHCIGANLARMELRVALEEWFKRFPEFVLDKRVPVTWAAGPMRGPRSVPVLLDVEPRQSGE